MIDQLSNTAAEPPPRSIRISVVSKAPDSSPSKPAPPKAKKKPNPHAPATKAEHAALKRIDKMVIKRMRKR